MFVAGPDFLIYRLVGHLVLSICCRGGESVGGVSMSYVRLLKSVTGLWPMFAHRMGHRPHSIFVVVEGGV